MLRYTIYAGSDLIYNPRIIGENGEALFKVLEPTLKESTESFSTLTFSALKGSPAYDSCTELTPRIKVYNGADLYWTGRVLNVTPDIYDKREYYVEDFLGILLNTIYRPFSFEGTVADFMEILVNNHNEQSNEEYRFTNVVCDITDEIRRSSEGYDTTWSVIKTKLLDSVGGFIWVDYDQNESPVLHYSKNPRNANLTPIQLGTNLSAFSVRNKFDKFYTACIPLGAKNQETKQYVTIAPVNDGLDYLIDEIAAERYGIIYAPTSETTWEDVTLPSNLLTRAQSWLQNQASRGVQEISISAVDASVYDINLDPYMWLDSVQVIAQGFNETMILKSITRRLDNPSSVSISMGMERSTVTGTQASKTAEALNRIGIIESNYTTGEQVAQITERTLEESTIIEQKANEIIAEVVQKYLTIEAYEGYEQTLLEEIATRLSTMAGELRADFTYEINEYGTDTQNKFSRIESFIRILAQTPTVNGGLVLGESTSQIKAKLENDVLYFFSGDETTVNRQNAIAYFAAGKLYVNEVQINRLTVGQTGQLMYFTIIGEGDNRCLFLSGRLV